MAQSYDRGTVESFGRWREFKAGMWAWILHKLTGWILVGYLFTHIAVLSTATQGAATYTSTLRGLEALLIVRFLEIGLLAVAVFHIMNGIRRPLHRPPVGRAVGRVPRRLLRLAAREHGGGGGRRDGRLVADVPQPPPEGPARPPRRRLRGRRGAPDAR